MHTELILILPVWVLRRQPKTLSGSPKPENMLSVSKMYAETDPATVSPNWVCPQTPLTESFPHKQQTSMGNTRHHTVQQGPLDYTAQIPETLGQQRKGTEKGRLMLNQNSASGVRCSSERKQN